MNLERPAQLADFEPRMEEMADALVEQAPEAPEDRLKASRALFYAGFLPHVALHGIEDGYLSAGPQEQARQLQRMQRSEALLAVAASYNPKDARIATVQRSVRFNREILSTGQISDATSSQLTEAVKQDLFATFAGMILLRDPERFPMDSPPMERFFSEVCGKQRFDCDRQGPPTMSPGQEPTLTTKVAGPVILSDLLWRRGEMLLRRADGQTDPAQRGQSLGEAMGRLQAAQGSLLFAEVNLVRLDHYPATAGLVSRKLRIAQLIAATKARLADPPTAQPLPDLSYYKTRDYRSAYQCTACHTQSPGGSEEVPQ